MKIDLDGWRKMNNDFMLNSSLEFGLRALVILCRLGNGSFDTDDLLVYDYVLTNSGDFSTQHPSIHISTSYKYSKLYTKREAMKKGIDFLSYRGLIDVVYDEKGIMYKSNKYSIYFLDNISSIYKTKLIIVADWIAEELKKEGFAKALNDLKNKSVEEKIYFYNVGSDE